MVVPAVPLPGCPVHPSVLAARQGAATEAAAGALAAADEARAAVGSAMAAQARPTPATRRRLTRVFRFIAGFLVCLLAASASALIDAGRCRWVGTNLANSGR